MFVRLLDKPDAEIMAVINRWVDGDGDDFDELMELLLCDQSWWSDRPIAEDDPRHLKMHLAEFKAQDMIDTAVLDLHPTPLNFERVRKWCVATYSVWGYEKLLTTFEPMLTGERFDELIEEAEELFSARYVALWCASHPHSRTHPANAGFPHRGLDPATRH